MSSCSANEIVRQDCCAECDVTSFSDVYALWICEIELSSQRKLACRVDVHAKDFAADETL